VINELIYSVHSISTTSSTGSCSVASSIRSCSTGSITVESRHAYTRRKPANPVTKTTWRRRRSSNSVVSEDESQSSANVSSAEDSSKRPNTFLSTPSHLYSDENRTRNMRRILNFVGRTGSSSSSRSGGSSQSSDSRNGVFDMRLLGASLEATAIESPSSKRIIRSDIEGVRKEIGFLGEYYVSHLNTAVHCVQPSQS
jgi:hypothetical protein